MICANRLAQEARLPMDRSYSRIPPCVSATRIALIRGNDMRVTWRRSTHEHVSRGRAAGFEHGRQMHLDRGDKCPRLARKAEASIASA